MYRFLTTITSSLLFFGLVMAFLFSGVLIIPKTMQTYASIIDTLLVDWLIENDLGTSWWVAGLMLSMALVAVNAAVCSYDMLKRRFAAARFLQLWPPQILHIGVIVMLIGHLTTAMTGFRTESVLSEGGRFPILDGVSFVVDRIVVESDPVTVTRWEVHGGWLESGALVEPVVIRPGSPSYFRGIWLFVKNADRPPLRAVLTARTDVGASIVAAGAALFLAGGCLLLIARRLSSGG